MKLDNGGFTVPASGRQGHAGLPGSRWPLQDHKPPVIQQFRNLRFGTLREQLSEHSAATGVPALLERALHAHTVLVREKVHQVFNGLPLGRVAISYRHGCVDDSSARLVVNLEARFIAGQFRRADSGIVEFRSSGSGFTHKRLPCKRASACSRRR